VHKLYIAEVAGRPSTITGVIDAALGPHPDPAFKPRYVVDPQGKSSVTNFKVLKVFDSQDMTVKLSMDDGTRQNGIEFQFADTEEDFKIRFSDSSSQVGLSINLSPSYLVICRFAISDADICGKVRACHRTISSVESAYAQHRVSDAWRQFICSS
jgi:hypothetical protein